MTGSSIALDTNIAVDVLNDVPRTIQWLAGIGEIFLPVPVIGELRFGALKSSRASENQAKVDRLVARCRVLPADLCVANRYASVRIDLSGKGTPIPENDIWIAATCLEHGLTLATFDRHFSAVPGLATAQP